MTASNKLKIILRGFSAKCRDFRARPDGEPEETSIVIVPIKLIRVGGDVLISWSCNKGGNCFSPCTYAWGWKNVKQPMEART